MGRPDKKTSNEQTLALTVNAQGDVNYDAVLKQGKNANKYIASTHGALIPKVDKLNDEEVRGSRVADESAQFPCHAPIPTSSLHAGSGAA